MYCQAEGSRLIRNTYYVIVDIEIAKNLHKNIIVIFEMVGYKWMMVMVNDI